VLTRHIILANNFQKYTNLLGSGITFWAVNPHALDDPMAYWKSLYPNTTTQAAPGITWDVWMKELSSYLQADFSGGLGSMTTQCPTPDPFVPDRPR